MDECAEGRWWMILGRGILTALLINLKFSEQNTQAHDGTLKGSTAPMVDMGMYEFKFKYKGNYT